jgi:hypothetical protein
MHPDLILPVHLVVIVFIVALVVTLWLDRYYWR